MSNPVLQWQIVTPDPESAATFYKSLFGWKITANNSLGYREAETGGTNGGIWPAPPDAHSFVQLFIAVEDVARCVDDATKLGARVIVPVTSLPDGDTIAILHDPNGMSFGVMQQK
jgi:predicted enzyme related to lactoylglutathione lyase